MNRPTLDILRRLLVAILTIAAIFPLAWLAAAAFGLRDGHLTLDHLRQLLAAELFAEWLTNSLFIAACQTLLAVVLCSLGGFALRIYRFPGRGLVIVLLAMTVLVPWQVTLPGLFSLTVRFGWIDTFAAVILPGAVSVFGLFLYALGFRHVPMSVIDAARMDGCPEWRIWWSIALPLVRPTTAAFTLLGFLASWNNLLWPAAVLTSPHRHTLPIGLDNMSALPAYEANPGPLMAATLVGILPVVILFFFCQRDLVRGLGAAGGR